MHSVTKLTLESSNRVGEGAKREHFPVGAVWKRVAAPPSLIHAPAWQDRNGRKWELVLVSRGLHSAQSVPGTW